MTFVVSHHENFMYITNSLYRTFQIVFAQYTKFRLKSFFVVKYTKAFVMQNCEHIVLRKCLYNTIIPCILRTENSFELNITNYAFIDTANARTMDEYFMLRTASFFSCSNFFSSGSAHSESKSFGIISL